MSATNSTIMLGEVVNTQKGYAFKSKWYSDYGTQIVKVSDFTYDSIDKNNLVCIPNEIAEDYQKYKLDVHDVIVQTVGSWPSNPASVVGKVIRVPDNVKGALLNQNAVKLIPNHRINKKYLFYLLKSPKFKGYIINTAQGAASQASITLDSIRHFEFELPSLKTQQRIASILSAFDNLIENNTRRIAILEEMARLIYRGWFVHYRYPGHENDRLVDSGTELGEVPEGWGVAKISDVVDTIGGGTPSRKKDEYWSDGTIEWYTPSDLTAKNTMFIDSSGERINELGLKKSSAKIFPPQSVMMTSRATIGVISINTTEASTNQGFITCVPNDRLNKYQIYFWLKEIMPLIDQYASGATYKEINKTTFRNIEAVVPAIEISKRFYELVDPIGRQIQTLQRQTQKLKVTRDLLLPKLISGKVGV